MRSRNFLQWPVITGFTLLSAWFFLASGISPGKNSIADRRNGAEHPNGDNKICKIVKAEDIKKALVKSKSKKIILNIYPVKLSNNSKKKDFDLMIFFQDDGELERNLGNKINSKTFETQSAWYVGFLKGKNIPVNNIPFGYYIEITSAFIQDAGGLSICVLPEKAQMEHCLLPGGKKFPGPPQAKGGDSTGKCPPDCCSTLNLVMSMSDSTGKCPPMCRIYSLLLEKTMKAVIAKEYK